MSLDFPGDICEHCRHTMDGSVCPNCGWARPTVGDMLEAEIRAVDDE